MSHLFVCFVTLVIQGGVMSENQCDGYIHVMFIHLVIFLFIIIISILFIIVLI